MCPHSSIDEIASVLVSYLYLVHLSWFWDENVQNFYGSFLYCTSSTVPLVDLSLEHYISYKDIITMHKIEK